MVRAPVTERRNAVGLAWHGTFLAAASALAQPTTILPAYVLLLGGSPLAVGVMLTLLLSGSVLPELFFAYVVEGAARKRPFLIVAVYSRAAAWLALGVTSLVFARSGPGTLLLLLFLLLTAFSLGGSLGSVAYTGIFGQSIAPGQRGRFYAMRQFLGAFAALGVTYWAGRMLALSSHDRSSYAVLFLAAGALMLIAGAGFLALRETPESPTPHPALLAYLREMPALWRRDPGLRALVVVENVASLHLMLLPFYMYLAVVRLHVGVGAVASFTMAQVVGGALSNVVWGTLNDRFGSGAVLRACLVLGASLPFVALSLSAFAPAAYGLTFVLLGAAINSRTLAYNNVLVDLAPVELRATYTGLVGTLTAPTLVLPLIGGSLIAVLGSGVLFAAVGLALGAAALALWRSPACSARAL